LSNKHSRTEEVQNVLRTSISLVTKYYRIATKYK